MTLIGISGYSLASCAYLVFILLLLAARNKTLSGRLVLLSSMLVLCSSAIATLQIDRGFSFQIVLLVETFKLATWSMLIMCTQTSVHSIREALQQAKIKKYLLVWLALSGICWLGAIFQPNGAKYLFTLFLLLNLWLMVLLEQLFRNAEVKVRWALLPLILAIGINTAFDFVLFAQAVMVNQLDFNYWYVRGFVVAIGVPFILISTRRIKHWSVNVFVSRGVVFYSSMLLIAGLYLLLMAIAGYVINYFGGEWGQFVSLGFFVLGSIVLAVLLMTENIRRQIKVFISKHFFANKYEYREEWLKLIGKIETASSESYYQMSLKIMMSKIEATGGAILKATGNNKFITKFHKDLELDSSFDKDLVLLEHFTKNQGWIIDINEYSEDPLSYPSLFIHTKSWHAAGINILVPIFIGKAFYGFFVLANSNEHEKLNWEDRDLLFAIAKQLGNFISLNEANDKLAESKQFDAFNQMSAFLVHDLKNIQAQLELITANAEQHRDNPEFVDDVFETVESATERLGKVLTQLRNKQVAQSTSKRAELGDIIEKVIAQRNVAKPRVTLTEAEQCLATIDDERFFSVMNHLIQNAQEATDDEGWVKVSLTIKQQTINIVVSDNGCGMSESFIKTRLFKPFDTTKGNAGMGIGVFEAKQFFESVAGHLMVESVEGQGTRMIISLPM